MVIAVVGSLLTFIEINKMLMMHTCMIHKCILVRITDSHDCQCN